MTPLRALATLALALLLSGCGGSTPVAPVTAPPESGASTDAAVEVESDEPSGPYGELGTSSVGPVEIGMSPKQVEAIFGKPEDKQEVSFAGPGVEAPQLDWVWTNADGAEFRLQFATSDDTVTGYRSFWPDLKTADGFTVGSTREELEAKYGDELGESPIGVGGLMVSEGEKNTFPAIVFATDEKSGKVVALEGGMLQPAGD